MYTFFRVPEPRGRSFAELDMLFERKIDARKFANTQVDVFGETIQGQVVDEYQAQKGTRTDVAQLEKEAESPNSTNPTK